MQQAIGPRGVAAALLATALVAAGVGCARPGAPAVPRAAAAGQGGEPAAELVAPGVLSDAQEQWRITFTADGRTAYFASSPGFFPVTRQATIYVSRLVDGAWTAPEVAPFSGRYSDIDPFVAPDGRRLYFSSIRPVDGVVRGDIDLWYVERTANGWGEPVRLGPEVNTDADELYASADARGTLYFASGPPSPQPGRHWDIYRAERAGDGFAPREALPAAVNTSPAPGGGLQAAWEFNPEISPDGRTLVFASLRPGGHGLGDLYVSRFERGAWTPARNLGPPVNTAADEYHPTLSPDGRMLWFARRVSRQTGGDFYRVDVRAAGLR
jgi:hypothetical protein